MSKKIDGDVMIGAGFLALVLAGFLLTPVAPAFAGNTRSQGFNVFTSSQVSVNQTQNMAVGRPVLHCVHISSAIANSNLVVYDSSNTTTASREVVLSVSGGTIATYCPDVEMDLGISYVSNGSGVSPVWTMTWLPSM